MPGTVAIDAGADGGGEPAAAAAGTKRGAAEGAAADCATCTNAAAAEHSRSNPSATPLAGHIGNTQTAAASARSGPVHTAMRNQRRTCWPKSTSKRTVRKNDGRNRAIPPISAARNGVSDRNDGSRHDQVDAELAEGGARPARVAMRAVAGPGLAQQIGADQARVGRHHQRGVEEPGMRPDLGLAVAFAL